MRPFYARAGFCGHKYTILRKIDVSDVSYHYFLPKFIEKMVKIRKTQNSILGGLGGTKGVKKGVCRIFLVGELSMVAQWTLLDNLEPKIHCSQTLPKPMQYFTGLLKFPVFWKLNLKSYEKYVCDDSAHSLRLWSSVIVGIGPLCVIEQVKNPSLKNCDCTATPIDEKS